MASNVSNGHYYCYKCKSHKESLHDFKCPTCNSGFIELIEAVEEVSVVTDLETESVQTTQNIISGEQEPPSEPGFTGFTGFIDMNPETGFFLPNWDTILAAQRSSPLINPFLNFFGMPHLIPLNQQNPGLTEREISDLPKRIIQQADLDKNPQCTICLEDFTLNEEILKLSCDHLFHQHCVITWLKNNASCPVCRNTLKEAPSTLDRPSPSHSASMNHEHRSTTPRQIALLDSIGRLPHSHPFSIVRNLGRQPNTNQRSRQVLLHGHHPYRLNQIEISEPYFNIPTQSQGPIIRRNRENVINVINQGIDINNRPQSIQNRTDRSTVQMDHPFPEPEEVIIIDDD